MGAFKDETGKKYGRLTVLVLVDFKFHTARWKCVCDCGKEIVTYGSNLRSGNTSSCGCYCKEIASQICKKRIGEKHPNFGKLRNEASRWQGGKASSSNGYVKIMLRGHPRSQKTGYVFEHILVMEKMLGRFLSEGEVVHHCNEDHADNRPYNLRLFASNKEHLAYHRRLNKDMGIVLQSRNNGKFGGKILKPWAIS